METDFEALTDYYKNGRPSKGEVIVIDDYLKAFETKNIDRLKEYADLGPTIRHRVMNMNAYNHNVLFGYYHRTIDSNNWLDRVKLEIETITFETKIDKDKNNVELGKGLNGKYSFGWHFNFGMAGSYSGAGVYRTPINTRDEAFEIAVNYAKTEYTRYHNSSDKAYNQALISQVLESINQLLVNNKQLELFG